MNTDNNFCRASEPFSEDGEHISAEGELFSTQWDKLYTFYYIYHSDKNLSRHICANYESLKNANVSNWIERKQWFRETKAQNIIGLIVGSFVINYTFLHTWSLAAFV